MKHEGVKGIPGGGKLGQLTSSLITLCTNAWTDAVVISREKSDEQRTWPTSLGGDSDRRAGVLDLMFLRTAQLHTKHHNMACYDGCSPVGSVQGWESSFPSISNGRGAGGFKSYVLSGEWRPLIGGAGGEWRVKTSHTPGRSTNLEVTGGRGWPRLRISQDR